MGEENTKNLAFKFSFSFLSYSHQLAASHSNLVIPVVLKRHIILIFTALNFVIIAELRARAKRARGRSPIAKVQGGKT